MSEFNHSPERDEEVFKAIQEAFPEGNAAYMNETVRELAAIAKKWRAKANMRAARIEDLEKEIDAFKRIDNPKLNLAQLKKMQEFKDE